MGGFPLGDRKAGWVHLGQMALATQGGRLPDHVLRRLPWLNVTHQRVELGWEPGLLSTVTCHTHICLPPAQPPQRRLQEERNALIGRRQRASQ